MSEFDPATLSRHLDMSASQVPATANADRLLAGFARVDRMRRIRAIGATGTIVAAVAVGVLAFSPTESATEIDMRGEVPGNTDGATSGPETELDAAGLVNRDGDPADEPAEVTEAPTSSTTTEVPTTTTAAPSTTAPTSTTAAPSTTAPPSTTAAPTTTVAPATTAPPTTTVVAVAFSAQSQYGSCSEDPPYDNYSGTATPGTTITITSPYSAAVSTVADGSGHWYQRVEFSGAPYDTPFQVTATNGSDSVSMSFYHSS